MKKIIFGAFAAAALLSCSKDQLIEENRVNDEISFSVVADNQTKAADVYCANNLMTEFQVSGTYTYEGTTKWYFQNDEVTYSSSAWTNSKVRYWTAGTHDFYAIVNGTMTLTAEPDVPTVDFTPATNVAEQTDLLYAVAKGKKKSSSAVALNFRHALSQIEFKAKNTNAKLHVEITGVRVGQTPGIGIFTFPSSATDENFTDHGQGGTHNYTTGSWSVNTPTDYSVTFPTVKVTGNSSPIGLTLSTDAVGSSRNFTNSMLLLPTTTATTAWTPSAGESAFDGTYLGVDCKIYSIAGSAFNAATDVCLHDGMAVIPASFTWESGKKYIYTFVFGDGNGGYDGGDPDTPTPGVTPVLTPITYTVTVDDFQKGAQSDVNFEF